MDSQLVMVTIDLDVDVNFKADVSLLMEHEDTPHSRKYILHFVRNSSTLRLEMGTGPRYHPPIPQGMELMMVTGDCDDTDVMLQFTHMGQTYRTHSTFDQLSFFLTRDDSYFDDPDVEVDNERDTAVSIN